MAVRLQDIAEALGISKVTVSKVLRGAPDVGERTRELVLEQMKLRGYRPNMHARGLASGRSHAVGLIVPDLIHPFFGEFATALGSALRSSGLALIVASSQEDPETEQHEVRMLLARGVDVMVVASCRAKLARGLVFGDERTPFLLVDRYFSSLDAGFVGSPDVEVGALATRHLIELGRTRIAHIGGYGMSPAVDRLRGYKRALAQAGLPAASEYILRLRHFEEAGDSAGYAAMQQLMRRNPMPDAVFCYNDLAALGAMSAARSAGLSIPRDIAFVGCGNLRYAEHFRVPLTSIDHGVEEMGAAAARLATGLANDRTSPPQRVLIEPKLIARQSTVGRTLQRDRSKVHAQ
jgi:LacI family transcriptional regulator